MSEKQSEGNSMKWFLIAILIVAVGWLILNSGPLVQQTVINSPQFNQAVDVQTSQQATQRTETDVRGDTTTRNEYGAGEIDGLTTGPITDEECRQAAAGYAELSVCAAQITDPARAANCASQLKSYAENVELVCGVQP